MKGALDGLTQAIHDAVRVKGRRLVFGRVSVLYNILWLFANVGFPAEMVINFNLTLGNGTITPAWISSADAATIAERLASSLLRPISSTLTAARAAGSVTTSTGASSLLNVT